MEIDSYSGAFQALNVTYTLVFGRTADRTTQYQNGQTWTAMPRSCDWYWRGTRGQVLMQGHLYHNQRDRWMYAEGLVGPGGTYQMLVDCHEVDDGDAQ
jgi:hypothetical protein